MPRRYPAVSGRNPGSLLGSPHMLEARTHADPDAAAATRAGAEVVVENVSKSYDSRIVAVRDASLSIEPGEFVSLTGPSGCGKSTLLNLIGSLARPDSGSITVGGIAVQDLRTPSDYRRSVVGFVFQLHHLLPMLSAGGNVEVPLSGTGLGRRESRVKDLAAIATQILQSTPPTPSPAFIAAVYARASDSAGINRVTRQAG